jgi:hypothetical protein
LRFLAAFWQDLSLFNRQEQANQGKATAAGGTWFDAGRVLQSLTPAAFCGF